MEKNKHLKPTDLIIKNLIIQLIKLGFSYYDIIDFSNRNFTNKVSKSRAKKRVKKLLDEILK